MIGSYVMREGIEESNDPTRTVGLRIGAAIVIDGFLGGMIGYGYEK